MYSFGFFVRLSTYHELVSALHYYYFISGFGFLGHQNLGKKISQHSLVYKYRSKRWWMDLLGEFKIACLSLLTNFLVFIYYVWTNATRRWHSLINRLKAIFGVCYFDWLCGELHKLLCILQHYLTQKRRNPPTDFRVSKLLRNSINY